MANEFKVKNGLITPNTIFQGSTSGTATLLSPAVAGTTTITLPGATGTLATLAGTETLTNKTLTSPTISGLYLSDASIVFEGASADAFETTLTVTDPTADRTITIPNVTGTLITTGDSSTVTNTMLSGSIALTKLLADTSTALGVGSIELGHASDTTLSRSSAGVLAVEGVAIPSVSSTNTLTNKSLSDSTTYFIDETDSTKKMQFQISGVGTGVTRTLAVPNNDGTIITSGDTGSVTNTMLAGSIANNKLSNSSITINGSSVSLGSSLTVSAVASNALTIGTGLSGTSYNGSAAVTIAIDNTVATLAGTETLTNKTLTSPTINTSIVAGSASMDIFNTTATTLNFAGASTSLTIGYSSTAASTTNISTGAVAAATTKIINIGTGGAASSTTNINLGSSNGGTVTVNKDLVVSGDLTVNGTTATVNSTTITVDDKNIELGSVATPTNTTADGGGITLKGATDKTFNWVNATSAWTSSEHVALASGKNVLLNGSTSGTITLAVAATAGTNTVTFPATTGNVVTTGDSSTVTNTMLAGSIALTKLLSDTTTALGLGTLELGHASDTTLSRSSAGVLAVEGVVVPTISSTSTLTNKTLTAPVIDNIKLGYTTTATAAGTTTLTVSSNYYQRFTGTTTQTVVLPVTSTLVTGISYAIENASTGNLTVNSSGGNLVATVIPGTTMSFLCVGTTLTTAADWDAEYIEFATITGTGSLALNTSPTFATGIDGGATFSAFASSTTLTLGYSSTAASTTNISTGAVAAATTKTINIGTGGAASSTTNINLGSSNGGTVIVNSATTSTSTTTGALQVAGGVGIGGALHVGNGISVAYSTNFRVYIEPNFDFGTDFPVFNNTVGTNKVGFSNVQIGNSSNGSVQSTSTTTGNLVVYGGVGIGQNLNVGGLLGVSITAAVSAAGSTQGTATALTTNINNVTTVAASTGVRLPTAVAGYIVIVRNGGANALNVYPATGAAINAGAANAAHSLPVGAMIQYVATSTTQWYTMSSTFA